MDVQEILMKRILLGGLLMAALAGTVLAQQPIAQVPDGQPASTYTTATPATAGHHGGSSCCAPANVICVPECYDREKKTPVYSSVCEPVCLSHCGCHLFGLFGHCDSGCDGGQCDHPRTRHWLVKRYCIEHCPETRCVPVSAPACDAAPCYGVVPGGPVQTIPLQTMPK
jgi:hypothetical protein